MPLDAKKRSFEDLLDEAERRPLVGWDLSYDGRIGFSSPWDFEALVDRRIRSSPNMLDMGTGGGEWLSRRPFVPGQTVATEAWAPNVPVARSRLQALGVNLVAIEGAPDNVDQLDAADLPRLPFVDRAFHLVTNRHESFVAFEVARVLAPGGYFVTQQIGPNFDAPLRWLLGWVPQAKGLVWDADEAIRQLAEAGLVVQRGGTGHARITFADVGALAWYLFNVPWVLPDIGPSEWRPRLETLYGREGLSVEQPMFWLEARNV